MNENERPELQPLPDQDDLTTRAVEEQQNVPQAVPRKTGPLDRGLAAPWVIDLRIENVTLSYRLEADQRMLLGRADANVLPELDLTPFGGLEKGVSRRHAVLVAAGDRLEIIDLKSTNGTMINRQRILPFRPYRLRHGDEIGLGDLTLELLMGIVPVHVSPRWNQPWVDRRSVENPTGRGKRVLVVEDNPQVSAALQAVLARLDYNVQVVESFSDAFYAVTMRLPDAIVLNLDLNIVNGLEICRYIQRLADNQHIPLVILSEHTDRTYVDEVMGAGVDVFLGKPVGIDELVRAVANVTQDDNLVSSRDSGPLGG
ncbi:MAG: hypothetical protein Kow0077_23790 [Anaerolineae bacterium]